VSYRPAQLIIGESGSGKTSLAKVFARDKVARGLAVGVLDPAREKWPDGVAYQTHDRAKFLDWVARNYALQKFLIVDESTQAVGAHCPHFDFISTTGRHLAIASLYVCHRLENLSRQIQATRTKWIFCCGVKDAKQLADSHSLEALADAWKWPALQFIRVAPFTPPMRGRIVFKRGVPQVEFECK
jgi:hypothetical protein